MPPHTPRLRESLCRRPYNATHPFQKQNMGIAGSCGDDDGAYVASHAFVADLGHHGHIGLRDGHLQPET